MRRTKTPRPFGRQLGLFCLSILLGAGLLATPAFQSPSHAKSSPSQKAAAERRAIDGFPSQNKFVRVEVLRAAGTGRKPAVIILHGASGFGDGSMFYPQAQALVDRGISAFIVHYFDGLGTVPKGRKASPVLHDDRDRVIADALSYVESRPFVDPDKIGLFGLSLGGFHAVGLASRDSRIAAVVNMVGAMPNPVARDGIWRMPPTLILHGDRDRIVPVRRAYELAKMLDEMGATYELKIFHGQQHAFKGSAFDDSVRLTAEFFERHLNAAS